MLVSSEFLPASVLPAMAADLGISEGTAGLAVAATAIAGAVTAPSIAALLPRADRRTVLVGLLVAATVSNLAVAVAPGFAVLLLGRLVLGVAIAGYWSFALGAGTHAVPGRDSVISTSLALGVTLATVAGVPLASLVGDAVGWRTVFGIAAGLGAATAIGLAAMLPPVPPHPAAGLTMLRQAIGSRRLMAGVLGVVLVAFGNFSAYPFIRLAIEEIDRRATVWLLLAWGVGGLVGNLAAGWFAGRLRVVVSAAPLLLGAGLLITTTAPSLPVLAVGVVLWGVAFNMVPVATQLWVTRVEPERAESALSLQVTAFQVAITLGSASGGALLDGHGLRTAFVVGAAFALTSGALFSALRAPRG
ncbi:MFS transporter [Actinomadura sp. NBRC 104412]|nr:MFS transporter [Actinomadura sp. NBRC 104412]GLZ08103.1 MFS transporter [Actinomadura sp. NBRC 104412]